MILQHNLSAINANRQLNIVTQEKASSTEKLSSGYKINRSSDDAAGLSISEKMKKEIRGLNRASRNIEDGISYVQVADGALNEVHDMLQRINELAVQAANGTNSETDREYINDEVQNLKNEMERIFVTTKFNEQKIWNADDPTVIKTIVGSTKVQALQIVSSSKRSFTINNDNYQFLPVESNYKSDYNTYYSCSNFLGNYSILADETNGVSITWTAFNGNTYTSDSISWTELKAKDYKFNVGDLIKSKVTVHDINGVQVDTNASLTDSSGKPLIDYELAFSPISSASNAEKAKALNGVSFSSTAYSDWQSSLSQTTNGVRVSSTTITQSAAYADKINSSNGYDFNGASTTSEIKGTFKNDSGVYKYEFTLNGIGKCTATWERTGYTSGSSADKGYSSILEYSNYSTQLYTDENENIWWERSNSSYRVNGKLYPYYYQTKYYNLYGTTTGNTTEKTISNALKGSKADKKNGADSYPGLLTVSNGGASDSGGTLYLSFSVTSDNPYQSGKNTNNNYVGEIVFAVDVSASDTEASVLTKVKNAFKNDIELKIDNKSHSTKTAYVYTGTARTSTTNINEIVKDKIYEDIELDIHSGADDTDKIHLKYKCLRLASLGLTGTRVLTEQDALNAIDEISEAINIVSAQRSQFGAYQNRMQHAFSIDTNTSENTQAAQSKIADTDIAKEMVKFSNTSILEQAGNSMLAQSNQKNQGILKLLQ